VGRLACIDLPDFPLQLLAQEHPEWQDLPLAVVAEDRPQALLLYVNELARRAGIRTGQRYTAALSLALALRAGTVPAARIAAAVARLAERLRVHTPEVEPAADEPGVFWLDADGFERLYGSLARWTAAAHGALAREGFHAHIAVGFSRFGTYAAAKSGCGQLVLQSPEQERRLAAAVPLARLTMDPILREGIEPLGVRTVGDFLRLPPGGLHTRFGPLAHRLHRLAGGELWAPLQPLPAPPAHERSADLEPPETDAERMLFTIKRLLDSLLLELAAGGEAVQELRLALKPERGDWRVEHLRSATSTLDGVQLLRLVHLRLEALGLSGAVSALRLSAEAIPATGEQLRLAAFGPGRDPTAAARAFARLRAALGEGAVVRAQLLDAHLPGDCFRWEPIDPKCRAPSAKMSHNDFSEQRAAVSGQPKTTREPRAASRDNPHSAPRPLVRRIYAAPQPLAPRPRHEPDGWLLAGLEAGPASHLRGPYAFAGGWWAEAAERDYYFVALRRGDIFWVYRDRRLRRWFLEGRIE